MTPLWRHGPFGPISVRRAREAGAAARGTCGSYDPFGQAGRSRRAPVCSLVCEERRRAPRGQQGQAFGRGRRGRVRQGDRRGVQADRPRGPHPRASAQARRPAASSRPGSAAPSAASEALRDSLPEYYAQAVVENDVDVIAPPEIDITAGQEEGDVAFDAVVEVRPVDRGRRLRRAAGRPSRASMPTDEEIDAQVERMRAQFAELEPVDRPALDGDHVTIDIAGSPRRRSARRPRPPTTTCYEVGSGASRPSSTSTSRGAKAGDDPGVRRTAPRSRRGARSTSACSSRTSRSVSCPSSPTSGRTRRRSSRRVDELRADLADRHRPSAQDAGADGAARACGDGARRARRRRPARGRSSTTRCSSRLQDLAHAAPGPRHPARAVPRSDRPEPATSSSKSCATAAVQAVKVDLALRAVADAEGIEVHRRRGRRGDRPPGRARAAEAGPVRKRDRAQWADTGGTLGHHEAQGARVARRARRGRRPRGATDRPRSMLDAHDEPTEADDRRPNTDDVSRDRPTKPKRGRRVIEPDPATTWCRLSSSRPTGASGPTTCTRGCSRSTSSSWARRSTTRSPTSCARSCCTSSRRTPTRTSTSTSTRPGGDITALFAIYDTMQYVKPDIATICFGQAASAAAVLLAAGTKGKRLALPHARVLLHQPYGRRGRSGHRPRAGGQGDLAHA